MEGVVAVGPIAGFLPVDIDLGFIHGTVEEQGVTLRGGVGRRGERGDVRGVPRGAHVGETARTPRFERGEGLAVLPDGDVLQVVLAVEWSVDSPVVGDGDQLPRLVGGRGHLMVGLLEGELPRGEQGGDGEKKSMHGSKRLIDNDLFP